jgi:DHA1 family bicyclomycin/chloramphenicol resistance-like MFS transporter
MNHLHISPLKFSFYQATTMASFGISSLLSSRFLKKFGMTLTTDTTLLMIGTGALGLFFVSYFCPTSPILICFSMGLFSAGTGLGLGSLAGTASSLFPKIRGISSSLMTTIRLLVTALSIEASTIIFDGTMFSIASLILGLAVIAVGLYGISRFEQDLNYSNSAQSPEQVRELQLG